MLSIHKKFWLMIALAGLSLPACVVQDGDDDGDLPTFDDDDDGSDGGTPTDNDNDDAGGDGDAGDDDVVDDDDTNYEDDAGVVSDDAGAILVEVPDLSGLSEEEARAALEAVELTVGELSEQEVDGGAAGVVIGQSIAAGDDVQKGTAVDLVITPVWDAERIADELELPEYPPDEEIDETVGGVDEDESGARDDVEYDLGVKYWPDRKLIAIIDELVKDDQSMITSPDDPDIVTDALERKKLALSCLEAHYDGDYLKALAITGDIAAHMLDTADRLEAARKVESVLGGQVITLPSDAEIEQFCQGLFTPELAVDPAEAAASTNGNCSTASKTIVTYTNSLFQRHDKALINGLAMRKMVRDGAQSDDTFVYKLAFVDSDPLYASSGETDEYGEFESLGAFIGNASQEQIVGFNHYQSGASGMPPWIKASIESSNVVQDAAGLVDENDVQSHAAAVSSAGTVGARVFVLGHGLGALYANRAYGIAVGSQGDLNNSVRVIGVGTPADVIAGDSNGSRYVNLEEDTIVTESFAGLFDAPLPVNVTNDAQGEPSGHEFVQNYLLGEAAHSALLALVSEAIDNVEAPVAVGTDGVITVTLTWSDANPDVDLHAFEPDGSHVFYQNKIGTSGELDVDDVTHLGPEHYTVSCSSLTVGTYELGVNYFSGSTSETAIINVEAGSQVRTFTVELDEVRGSAGNNTPVPVADIIVSEGEQSGTFVFRIEAR